jgi:PhnB protein
MMKVEPYLSYEGRCDEAIEFYKNALGARVTMLMRFKDAPPGACGGGMTPGDKVMHASVLIGDSRVMMSDGRCLGKPNFQGISLSLSADNDAESERLFNALLDRGGSVCVPIAKTFFASRFGMVTDRFGVSWMIITAS